MSPVSRGRKKAKSRSGQRILRPVAPLPADCDCPECSGEELDPRNFIADLTAGATELLPLDDPLEAEMFGAGFVAVGELVGVGFSEALSQGVVPELEQLATPESLATLLAIDAVTDGTGAVDAARRLAARGVPEPRWINALAEPMKVGTCRYYRDTGGEASVLLCSFERAGRSHGLLVYVDHVDCDAAVDIMLCPGEALGEVDAMMRTYGRQNGVKLVAEELDPAELRWHVERALDARGVHDQEDGGPDVDDIGDENGPG